MWQWTAAAGSVLSSIGSVSGFEASSPLSCPGDLGKLGDELALRAQGKRAAREEKYQRANAGQDLPPGLGIPRERRASARKSRASPNKSLICPKRISKSWHASKHLPTFKRVRLSD
jgi:hypothetical protein